MKDHKENQLFDDLADAEEKAEERVFNNGL
jgi:hypothetical protein